MGLISVFTAVFALGSYGYAMYVLPCAAAGFLVNLSIKEMAQNALHSNSKKEPQRKKIMNSP